MGQRRTTTAALLVVLLIAVGALAYAVDRAGRGGTRPQAAPAQQQTAPSAEAPVADVSAPATPEVAQIPTRSSALRADSGASASTTGRTARPAPVRILGPGEKGDKVRDLQVRLRELARYSGSITGRYDAATRRGVHGFQAKRGFTTTGVVDARTLRRLTAMTSTPSRAQKHNVIGSSASTHTRLDGRCTTGRAICIDKSSQTLRWVVDGSVKATLAVRFGASYSPTREGLFHVGLKSENHVSHLYGSAMPYSMFFSGGQAVHYSSDFAARGYAGASHGCVNVRDLDGIRWLFGQVGVGDKVVVYRA